MNNYPSAIKAAEKKSILLLDFSCFYSEVTESP